MSAKPGTGNTRLLIRNLRTKTILPNLEVERLHAIETAARAMFATEYGVGPFRLSTFDPVIIGILRNALAMKEMA
jgi:hypothetical protein